jgi:hypothetical protein
MAIGHVNPELWERFAQANHEKGLTIHRTLEKLIAVWLDVYGPEEFRIDASQFIHLHELEKPDILNKTESKRLVNQKHKV